MTCSPPRGATYLHVLYIAIFMSAQLGRAFRVLVRQPFLRRAPWQQQQQHHLQQRIGLSVHSSALSRLAKSSSEDAAAGGQKSKGRGPRSRNLGSNEEEELFAALTSQQEDKGSKSKAGKQQEEETGGDYESPVVDWNPEPGSAVLEALNDLRPSKRPEPVEAVENDGKKKKKKKKEWTIDTNWTPSKSAMSSKGRKPARSSSRLDMEPFENDDDLPSRPSRSSAAPVKAASGVKSKQVAPVLADYDSDDEPDFSEEAMGKIRFIDISGEDLEDFEEEEEEEEDEEGFDEDDVDDDDEEEIVVPAAGRQLTMEERLANAQKGAMFNPSVGQYSEPEKKRGRREVDRGDDDEMDGQQEPVRYQYKIVVDVGTCPGCGNSFQTKNESVPGFIPTDVYDRLQRRAAAVTAMAGAGKKGKEAKTLYEGLSPEEEVELLISGKVDPDEFLKQQQEEAAAAMEEEDEDDMVEEDLSKHVICQRCHKLKHYGVVDDSLRPGWSENEMLTPERFRDMVSVVRKKRCAIVVLVDIFDFHGSLLYNLARIVGDNPVMVAVNKADLLPTDFKEERVKIWVKQQIDKIGVKDVTTRDVFLISGKSGMGVKPLLRHMKTMARLRKRDLYVIGAANVGKSTFINRLIELGRTGGEPKKLKSGKKGGKGKDAGTLVTTSALPGTTLNFIEVDLGDRVSLFDTPGLIIPHQITTLLNTDELRAVIPQKRINHVTLRLGEGKSILMGGLARLDFVTGRPFLFTFYVSNDVKLHMTSTDKCDEFLDKHLGTELIFPPNSKERLQELGPWSPREFNITGGGWKASAVDIVISGLGWISVTGALDCTVRIMAPDSVGVRLRDPLMPYETWDTTARWTGLRAIKGAKKKGGSR